jgi:predicted metal-dependent enzyme (double-stranded beta helix superfamily)
MNAYDLESFIADVRRVSVAALEPADAVTRIVPLMERLLAGDRSFLRPEHRLSDPDHYRRNALYLSADGDLSLYALVWLPGQWTPVHDHGSWGVVGVVEGVLEEQSYVCPDGEICADANIRLQRGGRIVLREGSVSSFVPTPDHIHATGVSADRAPALTLHLYGRNMTTFHIYDLAFATRRLVDVPHHTA